MYLRNVKQILRAGGLDERRYGFSGSIALLRASGREGLVRLERDRRGGLRLFQGPALARGAAPPAEPTEAAEPAGTLEIAPAEPIEQPEGLGAEIIEVEPIAVVDTTAELLGRAKPKRPRTRAAASPGPNRSSRNSGHGKAAVTKPSAARRPKASKKTAARTATDDSGG